MRQFQETVFFQKNAKARAYSAILTATGDQSPPFSMPTDLTLNAPHSPGEVVSTSALHPASDQLPEQALLDDSIQEIQEINGPKGPEPTRFGDWERKGRCVDF